MKLSSNNSKHPVDASILISENDTENLYRAFFDWVRIVGLRRIQVISNRDILEEPQLFGEDYYIKTIADKLMSMGIQLEYTVISKDNPPRINVQGDSPSAILLHNISPRMIARVASSHRIEVLMPVYFIWNRSSPIRVNLQTLLGPAFWQGFVHKYIVPTKRLSLTLRTLGVFKDIAILPPKYTCPCCFPRTQKSIANRALKAVYIGSMNPKRFSLSKTLRYFGRLKDLSCEITVCTTSSVNESSFREGNVSVTIVRRRLSAQEKCSILSAADLFIAPSALTTMDSPISIMEAKYHGLRIVRI